MPSTAPTLAPITSTPTPAPTPAVRANVHVEIIPVWAPHEPLRVFKGAFKHGFVHLRVSYATTHDGLVDLIAVVRDASTNQSSGIVDTAKTYAMPSNQFNDLPATGVAEVTLRFLSQVPDGAYTVEAHLTPVGRRYRGRIPTVPRVGRIQFDVIAEDVGFADAGGNLVTAPPAINIGRSLRFQVPVCYRAVTPVKFAVGIKCRDPRNRGNPANPSCRGQNMGVRSIVPLFGNASMPPNTSLADSAHGHVCLDLDVRVFGGLLAGFDQSPHSTYTVDISIGRFGAGANPEGWAETRDRTMPVDFFIGAAPGR